MLSPHFPPVQFGQRQALTTTSSHELVAADSAMGDPRHGALGPGPADWSNGSRRLCDLDSRFSNQERVRQEREADGSPPIHTAQAASESERDESELSRLVLCQSPDGAQASRCRQNTCNLEPVPRQVTP